MTFHEAEKLSQRWHEHHLTVRATALLIRDIEEKTLNEACEELERACHSHCVSDGTTWALVSALRKLAVQETDDV